MFELDDEYAESDIPTTLIRSKSDCPNIEVCVCVLLFVCLHNVFLIDAHHIIHQ